MEARRKEIEHLDGEVRRLEQSITAECVDIGRRIASLDRTGCRNEELLKYLTNVDALRRAVDASRGDIDHIAALTKQVGARTQEIEENTRRRDQILRERQARFEDLGAGSFAVFKALPDREPWRPIFEGVLKIDVEMEQRNGDLRALEEEEKDKGFFERLRLKARKVMLRGEISRLDRAKAAAYVTAGNRAADSEFASRTEGTLRQLFDFARERRRSADLLSSENDLKLGEIERDRQELKRLGIEDRPEERTGDIRGRIQGMEKELEVMYCWVGQIYLERDLRREIGDQGLLAKYEIVSGLRESIRKKRQQADRLKAEIEAEEIGRKEKERRARRKQFEETMRVTERQIGVIDIEINMGLRRMEELKRVLTGEAPYTDAPPFPPSPDLYPPPPADGGPGKSS